MENKMADEHLYEVLEELKVEMKFTEYTIGPGFYFHYNNKDKTLTFGDNRSGADDYYFIMWNVSPKRFESFLQKCKGSVKRLEKIKEARNRHGEA